MLSLIGDAHKAGMTGLPSCQWSFCAAGKKSRCMPIVTPTSTPAYQHTSHSFPKLSRPSPVLFIISMIFINLLYILYYFRYIFKGNDSDLFNKSLIHL